MKLPRFSFRGLAVLVAASVGGAGLASSVSVVRPSDVGVVLHFGKIRGVVEPGLHFTAPFGVDRIVDVPTQRLLKEELGYQSASERASGSWDPSELLSGELDRVAVRWTVQYRITDPLDYLSRVRTPACGIRALSRSVMGALVGDRSTQEVVSSDHGELEEEAQIILQKILDEYRLGVEVHSVLVQESDLETEQERPTEGRGFDSCRVERESNAIRNAFGPAPVFPLAEWEQGVLTQFGRVLGRPIAQPGLHFKLPVVQQVRLTDQRLLVFTPGASEATTLDRKPVLVDPLVLWRITDPSVFYQRLHDEEGARSRLDDLLEGEIRSAIARHDLVDLVRSTDRLPPLELSAPPDAAPHRTVAGKREIIRREILEAVAERTQDLGLGIVALRLIAVPSE